MNLLKTLSVGLLAAALPGMASAQTFIYITGSTAFRAPTTCAIINALTTNAGDSNKCYAAANNGTLLKGQAGIFADGTVHYTSGVFDGTATTIVETNWTGSLAGVLDVAAQNTTLPFPDPTDATNVEAKMAICTTSPFGNSASPGTGVLVAGAYATITHAPQVTMTDSFASSAAAALNSAQIDAGHSIGGATTGAQLAALVKGAALAEAGNAAPIVGAGTNSGYLGIVPFEWVLGNLSNPGGTAGTPFTNITQQAANYLTHNGSAPFSMFCSKSTDTFSPGDFVYLIGRNEDSGTRIDALAEPQPATGFGINPKQLLLSFSGGSNTSDIPAPTDGSLAIGGAAAQVVDMQYWPASAHLNTEQFINWAQVGGGHGGYSGGGDVASVLGTPVNQTTLASGANAQAVFAPENGGNSNFIGYLGVADAGGFGSGTVNGGTVLTYNGVTPSTFNVNNGSYSFWSYEHMYYLTSGAGSISGTTLTFVNTLANSIASTYADYSSGGAAAPTGAAAGVLLLTNKSAAAIAAGSASRQIEGGIYTLNY